MAIKGDLVFKLYCCSPGTLHNNCLITSPVIAILIQFDKVVVVVIWVVVIYSNVFLRRHSFV